MTVLRKLLGWPARMAIVVLSVGLSACTVDKAGCDPVAMRSADFFSRVACDVSGSYDARAEDQKIELEKAQQSRAQLQQALLDLEAEQRQISQGLTVERARRDRLVSSLNAYLAQADRLSGQNALLEKQVLKTQAEVNRLNALPTNASAAQQQARLNQVKQEVQTLRAMLP